MTPTLFYSEICFEFKAKDEILNCKIFGCFAGNLCFLLLDPQKIFAFSIFYF